MQPRRCGPTGAVLSVAQAHPRKPPPPCDYHYNHSQGCTYTYTMPYVFNRRRHGCGVHIYVGEVS